MHFTFLRVIQLILVFVLSTGFLVSQETCDIGKFYSGEDVAFDDIKVLTSMGNVEEAEMILAPISLDVGKYDVTVTRVGDNLYKIDGDDIYIETRFCFEYSYSDNVLLVVDSSFGYDLGVLIFLD